MARATLEMEDLEVGVTMMDEDQETVEVIARDAGNHLVAGEEVVMGLATGTATGATMVTTMMSSLAWVEAKGSVDGEGIEIEVTETVTMMT